MKVDIAGWKVDARLQYLETHDGLVLRTKSALVPLDTALELGIAVVEATGLEIELLRVSGYASLTAGAAVRV